MCDMPHAYFYLGMSKYARATTRLKRPGLITPEKRTRQKTSLVTYIDYM